MLSGLRFVLAALLCGIFASTAAAQTLIPVKIGISVPDVGHLLVYVAQDKGFFKAEGLDSQLVQFDGDASARMALTADAIQVNSASIFPVIDSYAAGSDLTAIWVMSDMPGYEWFSLPKYSDIKDMKGVGKVGVSSIGAMSQHISAWAVARGGLNPDKDVSFVALGGPLTRVAALKAGQVDLIPVTPPSNFVLQAEGYKQMLDLKDLMPDFCYQILFVRKINLARDDKLLKAVIRGTLDARAWIIAHPEEATDILMEHTGATKEQRDAYAKTVAFATPYFAADGHFPEESINVFLGFYKAQGKFKDIPPISAFSDSRLIDEFKKNPPPVKN